MPEFTKNGRPCNLDLSKVFFEEKYNNEEKIIKNVLDNIVKKKKIRSVSFSESTKKYDGPEFAKNVVEFLIYEYFEKQIIESSKDIRLLLANKYGIIEQKTINRITELLEDGLHRINEIKENTKRTHVPVLEDTNGLRGLEYTKQHAPHLTKFIKLYKKAMNLELEYI